MVRIIQSIILEPGEITEAKQLWTVQAQTLLAQETHFNEWKKQFWTIFWS